MCFTIAIEWCASWDGVPFQGTAPVQTLVGELLKWNLSFKAWLVRWCSLSGALPAWYWFCFHFFNFTIFGTYSLLACTIQAFELATGDLLFEPPPDNEYHLALIIRLLGYIPKNIVSSGKNSRDFFGKKSSCSWDFGLLLSSKVNFLACFSR